MVNLKSDIRSRNRQACQQLAATIHTLNTMCIQIPRSYQEQSLRPKEIGLYVGLSNHGSFVATYLARHTRCCLLSVISPVRQLRQQGLAEYHGSGLGYKMRRNIFNVSSHICGFLSRHCHCNVSCYYTRNRFSNDPVRSTALDCKSG